MNFLRNSCRLTAAATVATLGKFQWTESQIEKEERVSQAVQRFLVTKGIPGVSVGVSVNGQTVLARGYGFADVENGKPCSRETVMRIASISKSISATIAAKLVEIGKLDLDKSIYCYVPNFPRKKFDGKEVDITIRQLLTHTSGIRHYKNLYKDDELGKWDELYAHYGQDEKEAEFLYRKVYKNTEDAVAMFKNDDLIANPGTKFSYTTHGYTLLGLCLEKASGEGYDRLAKKLFNELCMYNTSLDKNEPLIANRAKFYRRNRKHVLVNVPEVDCSYKHPSGGILSNVDDLLKFANAMLRSFQTSESSVLTFLKSTTVHEFWDTIVKDSHGYALGWVQWPAKCIDTSREVQNQIWYHTGAAVGASSILLIKSASNFESNAAHPQGLCIAILANMQNVNPTKLALEILEIFES